MAHLQVISPKLSFTSVFTLGLNELALKFGSEDSNVLELDGCFNIGFVLGRLLIFVELSNCRFEKGVWPKITKSLIRNGKRLRLFVKTSSCGEDPRGVIFVLLQAPTVERLVNLVSVKRFQAKGYWLDFSSFYEVIRP